jgi:hypothetical protein
LFGIVDWRYISPNRHAFLIQPAIYLLDYPSFSNISELLGIVDRPYIFSYNELKSATETFSASNILGEGGYGPVYKVRFWHFLI